MKANSKEYPTIQRLQGVIIVPANITEKTDDEGETSYDWERVDYPLTSKLTDEQLLADAASVILNQEKRTRLDAGFDLNGIHYDYDVNARIAYRELADELRDDPTYTTPWKASEGQWITMNAALYAQVKQAGKAHIESVFTWLNEQQQI